MPPKKSLIHLSDVFGKLHADHRDQMIQMQRRVADFARRFVEKRWPALAGREKLDREFEQRRRAARHFHRALARSVSAWDYAVSELRKASPMPFDARHLAEYSGRVNLSNVHTVPLDNLPDKLNRIAAMLAKMNNNFTPMLLEKLRAKYPALVGTLGLKLTTPAARSCAAVEPHSVTKDAKAKITKRAMALAVLTDHPDWTNDEIADAVGCARTSLSRWPAIKQARLIIKGEKQSLPRGYKNRKTVEMEAYNEDDS